MGLFRKYLHLMTGSLLRSALVMTLLLASSQVGSSTIGKSAAPCSDPSATQIGTSVLLVGIVGTYSLLAVKRNVSFEGECFP